jgi:hypothetical protein
MGPINGECFRAYVEQMLIPTLKPGEIVIVDNLGSHKAKAVRDAIKAAGARLWFLPPYSPDLTPPLSDCGQSPAGQCSNKRLPKSNTGCEWHRKGQWRKSGNRSGN